jgi:general secretion pathway protein G
MQVNGIPVFAVAWAISTFFAQTAEAWSSSASRTAHDIQSLAGTLKIYHREVGKHPDPTDYWLTLQRANIWFFNHAGPVKDRWGQPLIYRFPGKHGDFDLYSVGPNGVDDDGRLDDVSSWAGVNEGFHWKQTWPQGRFILRVGVLLALVCCMLMLAYPCRIVLPLAGMLLCTSVIFGCRLLMHPGVVNSRNQPLQLTALIALLIGVALFISFFIAVRKNGLARRRTQPAATN